MFNLPQPVDPKKLANISGYDTSSNQEAIPVPYMSGVAKIALTWVTPPYNLQSVTDSSDSGKKGVGATTGAKKWYADIFGIACVCPEDVPVDALLYVLVNDEIAFAGPLSRGEGQHHAAITLDTYCQEAWVRWGTKDHPLAETLILYPRGDRPDDVGFDPRDPSTWPPFDADGNPVDPGTIPPGVADPFAGHYDVHPAYRCQFGIEFKSFFLGASPNMPNVSVVIARGAKFLSLAAPVQTALDTHTSGGTGLAALTHYYYKVTALFAGGESLPSNEQSIITGIGSHNTITVSWNAVAGATGYRVYRGTAAGAESVFYAPGDVTTFIDTGAAPTTGDPPSVATAKFEAFEQGVNPMGPLFEVLTDPLFGAGLPIEDLHASSWLATASALTIKNMFVAPVLVSSTSLRGLVADYLQYYDGWLRHNAGLLEAGYFDHGPIDEGGFLELDSDDLTSEPSIQPSTLDDTKNAFDLVYTNRLKWWTDDTERYSDLANFNKVGERRPDRQTRPFIIDPALAQWYISEWGRMHAAEGGGSGSAAFKRESLGDLLPGDRFVINSTSFGLSMTMRMIALEWPADRDNVAKVSFTVERADWRHLYIQPPAPKDDDFTVHGVEIAHARIVELPTGLKDGSVNVIEVAVLPLRPRSPTIGLRTHVSSDGGTTYDQIGQQTGFAVWAKIKTEDYIAGTDVVDTTVGMVLELYGIDLGTIVSQSDQQRDDHNLLIFVGNEIMSCGLIEAVDGTKVRIYPRRGCYGTNQTVHAIDTEVWLVFRSNLSPIAHNSFIPGDTVLFKLQPYTATELLDLADADPISHTFSDGPFLLGDLELWGQGDDLEFTGRNPRFRVTLYDITGLGIIGVPGVVPAVYNPDTSLWYELVLRGTGDDITIGVREVGSAIAPIAGAPAAFNAVTGLWYGLSAYGTGTDIGVGIADTGSATPPDGGVPIALNTDNRFYYRIIAVGTGTDITTGWDTTAGFTSGDPTIQGLPDFFVRLEWRQRDATSGATVWTGESIIPERILGYEENAQAAGGPRRRFLFGVRAVWRKSDGSLGYTDWLERDPFSNPQSVGLGGTVTAAYDRIDIVLIPATDLDYLGTVVWRSLDPDFEVTHPLADGVELVHDGPENSYSIPQPQGTTYYYRSCSFDVFTPSDHASAAFLVDLDIGAAVPFTTLGEAGGAPSISPGTQSFTDPFNPVVSVADGQDARYTLDGTDVSPSSELWPYDDSIEISASTILKVRYYDSETGAPSQQATVVYTKVDGKAVGGTPCAAVSIRIVSGRPHYTAVVLALSCPTDASTIEYDLGSGPVTYTAPITVDLDESMTANATASGFDAGPFSTFDNSSAIGGP